MPKLSDEGWVPCSELDPPVGILVQVSRSTWSASVITTFTIVTCIVIDGYPDLGFVWRLTGIGKAQFAGEY